MTTRLFLFLLALSPALALAAEGGIPLDKANIDPDNQQSLQRGARLFVNYCLSCHSADLMRYERMGKDLGIDERLVAENLMFTGGRVGDLMTVATNPEDAKAWFGTVPPDLSVIARYRGVDWL
jgi:ubiquinol-cytochrome c reductase cytochrome c1 subunit